MKLFKGRPFNPGDKKPLEAEEKIVDIGFNIFKFNNRPKPIDKKRVIIITNFSEFGCESIGLMYCIPRMLERYSGCYFICVGWYGREYLYRHLVDEFWEVKEEYQWLREYSRAFAHESKNLALVEKNLQEYGQVLSGAYFGGICLGNTCRSCKEFWSNIEYVKECPKCKSTDLERSLFGDIPFYKKSAIHVPKPKGKILEKAKSYVKKRTVGIFARSRTCYGRNLTPDFYKKLINNLEKLNYNIIWLGEKQSVYPCPVDNILDFSRLPESRDLELTLAIISNLEFTIQFWTASTRLASIVDTPWILFESPDQIVGMGQEGRRIALTTDENRKKLVLSHYLNTLNNPDKAIKIVEQAIYEINNNNWNDMVDLVEDSALVRKMLEKRKNWK